MIIQAAVGKYYKILDSDDWVDSNNLEKLVILLKNNKVDMVFNPFEEIDFNDFNKKSY